MKLRPFVLAHAITAGLFLMVAGVSERAAKGELKRRSWSWRTRASTPEDPHAALMARAHEMRSSVVLLRRPGTENTPPTPSNATGAVIASRTNPGQRLILSNAHPFVGKSADERLLVGFADGSPPVQAHTVRLPPDPRLLDLSLIEADIPAHLAGLSLEPASRHDDWVATVGYPFGGLGASANTGRDPAVLVGQILQRGDDFHYAQLASMPGTSGAPVVNRKGKVVGVHTVGVGPAGQTPVYAGFSPVAEWLDLLPELERDSLQMVRTGLSEFAGTPLERAFALSTASTRVRPDAVSITGLEPWSLAARAGIGIGDVITALALPGRLGGRVVPATYSALKYTLLRLREDDGALDLHVMRDGLREPLKLSLALGRPRLEVRDDAWDPSRTHPHAESLLTPALTWATHASPSATGSAEQRPADQGPTREPVLAALGTSLAANGAGSE